MDNRFGLAFNIGQSRRDNATPDEYIMTDSDLMEYDEGDYEDIDREERDEQRVAALLRKMGSKPIPSGEVRR